MVGMTKLRERLADRMKAEAIRLDQKRTKKAMKRVLPTVEWIYTKATGSLELDLLTSAGWEPITRSDNPILGTSTVSTTLMRKHNPNL